MNERTNKKTDERINERTNERKEGRKEGRLPYCNIECITVEIRLHGKKWLLFGTYNPCRSLIKTHLDTLSKMTENYARLYDNMILL